MRIGRTWFIDFDGVIVKHGTNELLPGVKEWFGRLPKADNVIICTGRSDIGCIEGFESVLRELMPNSIYEVLTCLSLGERILINDIKPAQTVNGETFTEPMDTARAINLPRDKGLGEVEI